MEEDSDSGQSLAQTSRADNGIAAEVGVGSPATTWGQLVQAPALVLNLNYVPLNVCTVRLAIVLVDKGKAELLENHQADLHTISSVIDAPSIIRLVYLVRRPLLPRKLSKKEVFLPVLWQEGTGPHTGPRGAPAPGRWPCLGQRGGCLQPVQLA